MLQRARPKLKGGLNILLTQGTWFPIAKYDFAETVTAAGHTTLSTGANPWRHGIGSNKILNRATGKLEPVYYDAAHPVLEVPPGIDDSSPAVLLSETLADRLELSTQRRAKVVSIAGKARAAIAMGGKLGEAWWFSTQAGKFVTGTYYRKEFPAWVKAFNDKKPADAWFGKSWELLSPPKDYLNDDDRPFESDVWGMGRKFPHPLSGGLETPGNNSYLALMASPHFNDLQVAFAKAAIENEQMGKDDVPDLLAVSFSAFDLTYHLFGPYSWELQDHVLRLDKSVGELLAAAEKAAGGKQNLLVVFSADHGGAPIPEEAAALGLDGVRCDYNLLKKNLEAELTAKFNGAGPYVSAIEEIDVYLDAKTISDKKLDAAAVRRAAAAWISKQPDTLLAISRDDVNGTDPSAGYLPAIRASFHPDRSGDVLMILKPFHVLESEKAGTSHGQPHGYDTEVPAIFYGKNVKAQVMGQSIRVVDVAPTADPITSGFAYGVAPAGAFQTEPATGAGTALTSGETYYLVVLADIYQPIERCLFEAP